MENLDIEVSVNEVVYFKKEKIIYFYTSNVNKFNEIQKEFDRLNEHLKNEYFKNYRDDVACGYLYYYKLVICDVDIPEIQTTSVEEVIEYKLNSVLAKVNSSDLYTNNYMVEDTGLFINSTTMNGFPGALIKFYLNHLEVDGICKMNQNEPCDAITYIGYWDCETQTKHYFNGKISGKIAPFPSGKNGSGYDASFIPLNLNIIEHYETGCDIDNNVDEKTYADLSDEEKTKCNMRGLCAYNLCNYIKKK